MLAINIQDTRCHFVDSILAGLKTIETRTPRAWKALSKAGMRKGMRIGIVSNAKLVGYATIADVIAYASKEVFQDDKRHLVPKGSRYDWQEGKGKVGLLLCDVAATDPMPVPKLNHCQGWREI